MKIAVWVFPLWASDYLVHGALNAPFFIKRVVFYVL